MKHNMKQIGAVLSLALIVGVSVPANARDKKIIGYYPSWNWRAGIHVMSPAEIPYSKLDIIDYAFFYPRPDGNIVGRDSIGDELILKGERDTVAGGRKPVTALVGLAHKNGVKVMLSVGGWADSYNYPTVAASESTRVAFAHSCTDQLRAYGFDGIDIDWEYPCYSDHKGTPDDKVNFTKLLQITRDSLDAFGAQHSEHCLLTAAVPAVENLTKNFEMEKVSHILDMLNVMTYDLSGDWDTLSGYNSPLYAPNATDTARNVDAAFRLLTGECHVPAAKINLGVPFYGHTFSSCSGMYAPHKGADTVHFTNDGGQYYDIVELMNKFTRKWDSRAKVPYLVSTEWHTVVSYDDEESVGEKAQYVVDNHACGLIIWEITGDRLPDGSTPLLNAINEKFKGPTGR
jgi:chitinase